MSTQDQGSPPYHLGGTVPLDRLYVRRHADRELLEAFTGGAWNYVSLLAPRQSGKSSALLRLKQSLVDAGIVCVFMDLQGIRSVQESGISKREQFSRWCRRVMREISERLGIRLELGEWLSGYRSDPLMVDDGREIYDFFRQFVLCHVKERVVVIFDEIDTVLGIDYVEDFFIQIRALREDSARDGSANLRRLSFLFAGVATPDEFVHAGSRNPFNICVPVELKAFGSDESETAIDWLHTDDAADQRFLRSKVFDAVLAWTGGQPILTVAVCAELRAQGVEAVGIEEQVDRVVARLLSERSLVYEKVKRIKTDLLSGARGAGVGALLFRYIKVLKGDAVVDDPADAVLKYLKLSGLCVVAGRTLAPGNRIYSSELTVGWAKIEGKKLRHREGPFALFWTLSRDPAYARSRVVAVVLVALAFATVISVVASMLFLRSEALASEALASEALTSEALAKEALAKEALAKEALASEALASEALAKEALAKEALAKETLAKKALAKEALAKEALAKEALAKEALAKQKLTNEKLASEVKASEALATQAQTSEALAKAKLANEQLANERRVALANEKLANERLENEKRDALSKEKLAMNQALLWSNPSEAVGFLQDLRLILPSARQAHICERTGRLFQVAEKLGWEEKSGNKDAWVEDLEEKFGEYASSPLLAMMAYSLVINNPVEEDPRVRDVFLGPDACLAVIARRRGYSVAVGSGFSWCGANSGESTSGPDGFKVVGETKEQHLDFVSFSYDGSKAIVVDSLKSGARRMIMYNARGEEIGTRPMGDVQKVAWCQVGECLMGTTSSGDLVKISSENLSTVEIVGDLVSSDSLLYVGTIGAGVAGDSLEDVSDEDDVDAVVHQTKPPGAGISVRLVGTGEELCSYDFGKRKIVTFMTGHGSGSRRLAVVVRDDISDKIVLLKVKNDGRCDHVDERAVPEGLGGRVSSIIYYEQEGTLAAFTRKGGYVWSLRDSKKVRKPGSFEDIEPFSMPLRPLRIRSLNYRGSDRLLSVQSRGDRTRYHYYASVAGVFYAALAARYQCESSPVREAAVVTLAKF